MGILTGLNIVFTGTFESVRSSVESAASYDGAIVDARVTKRTDWVVCAKRPGKTKLNRAKDLGIRILGEEEYYRERNKRAREAALEKPEPTPAPPPDVAAKDLDWIVRLRPAGGVGF